MKNIRLFDTQAEYNAATLDYPNVAYVKETDRIIMQKTNPLAEYLNFTAKNGDATIKMLSSGSLSPNVSYSFDKNTWTNWNYSAITIPQDETIYFKGNNPNGFSTAYNTYKYFVVSGTVEANGNIMSLLYEDNFEDNLIIPNSDCFYRLFYNCSGLTSAPTLPATTLTNECYREMFSDCTSLTKIQRILPATTLAYQCYRSMFSGCINLTTAPQLPATTLTNNCYNRMFSSCTSLTTAPQLPATTLASSCYNNMFYGCTSLTTAPQLPAITLASECYSNMFHDCTNLNYIKMMATDVSASYSLYQWVIGVASSGTFVKNSEATWTTSGVIPNGWTVQTASE